MKLLKIVIFLTSQMWAFSSYAQIQEATAINKTNIVKLGFSSQFLFAPEGGVASGISGIGAGIEHTFGRGSFNINAHYLGGTNDFDQRGTLYPNQKLRFFSIEPDFRIYTKKNARGMFLGFGLGYSSWKSISIANEQSTKIGQLNVMAKLGYQGNLNEHLTIHFYTGLGVVAGGTDNYNRSFFSIPVVAQLGYRF
jgi:hypothetical protein